MCVSDSVIYVVACMRFHWTKTATPYIPVSIISHEECNIGDKDGISNVVFLDGDYGNRNIQGCRLCPMESHTCHNIDNTIRYTHSLHLHSISSMSTHLLHSSLLGLNSALIEIRGLSYPYYWEDLLRGGAWVDRLPVEVVSSFRNGLGCHGMSSSSIFGTVLYLELLVLLRM